MSSISDHRHISESLTPDSSIETQFLSFASLEAESPPPPLPPSPTPPSPSTLPPSPPKLTDAYLFVVLCPPDGGAWSTLTCMLGFMAMLICDGICLSLILIDSRVGMVESLPPGTRCTFEHLALIYLFRYLTEPFSCAYINRYGFRYCLFIGSILSVTWIMLLCLVDNTFSNDHFFLAIIGGIGMGMIKTSFFVLLSMLFIVKRHTAHLSLHLGSIAGMLIIPPITEYQILLTKDYKTALYIDLGMMSFTLILWLFVSTPVPLKLEIVDKESTTLLRLKTVAWNVEDFQKKNQTSTIQKTIGNQQLMTGRFLASIPMIVHTRPLTSAVRNLNYVNWFYEEGKNRHLCIRNVTNMFKNGLIGSRPIYRDDVFYDGNISVLLTNLKCTKNNIIEYNEYLMTVTRIYTIADVNEEQNTQRCWKCPIAIVRVLKCMFNMSIWFNEQFLLMAVSEILIHASCLVPFMFIKGPVGQKTSAEAMIILIAGCFGLLYGRGIGYFLHGKSSNAVPLYHVGIVLIINGLSLFLCSTTTDDISNLLPYFGIFGITFGYYKSIQNVVLYTAFPMKKFNNVCGQISLVRGVSSYAGILFAVNIMGPGTDGRVPTSCKDVYVYAGILMLIGGICVTVLQTLASANKPRPPYCTVGVLHRSSTTTPIHVTETYT